jgi:hypothetical protein
LWATVLADLQTRLANGEFDDRFPTDKELMSSPARSDTRTIASGRLGPKIRLMHAGR